METRILRETKLNGDRLLQLVEGDLTTEPVDAIVNAANSMLQHGGGLAAAIVRAGGGVIQQESNAWVRQHGPVSHAEPAYTGAGLLPCKYVIHAVGPVWQGGGRNEDADLAAAVSGALRLAETLKLASVAIPAISTGIFGYPKKRAAEVIFAAIQRYCTESPAGSLQTIRLTLLGNETILPFVQAFEAAFQAAP